MKTLIEMSSRRGFLTSLLAAATLMLAGCASDNATAPGSPNKPLRVLFIGNSYTYVNMLPEMIQQFAIAGKQRRPLEYRMIAPGGWSLEQHWTNGPERKAIGEGGWDYVVLQDQSLRPITNSAITHEYCRLFGQEVRKAGAVPVYYVTWARKNAPASQDQITQVYTSIAGELGALSSPVGPARATALKERPSLEFYQNDGSHPSPMGTYLAACVFYNVLYDKSPVGLPETVVGKQDGAIKTLASLSKEDSAFLQRTARQTVKEWNGGKRHP